MLKGVIYYLAFHNLDNPFSYASFLHKSPTIIGMKFWKFYFTDEKWGELYIF